LTPGARPSKSEAMEPVRVEMAPILMAVDVTPGALDDDVPAVVDEVAAVVEVVGVVDGDEEHPAAATAIPSASAPVKTRDFLCSPMAVLPPQWSGPLATISLVAAPCPGADRRDWAYALDGFPFGFPVDMC